MIINIANPVLKEIEKVCPVHGISIGRIHDKSTWRIGFEPEATEEQKADAIAVIDSFDISVELSKPPLKTKEELLEERILALEEKIK